MSATSQRTLKICQVHSCQSKAKGRGLCVAHGGGPRCRFSGCTKGAKKGGFCIAHGGGVRCRVEGCKNSAQRGQRCMAHGGGQKCKILHCNKCVVGQGLCLTHGGDKKSKSRGKQTIGLRERKRREAIDHFNAQKVATLASCQNNTPALLRRERCSLEGCQLDAKVESRCIQHQLIAPPTCVSKPHENANVQLPPLRSLLRQIEEPHHFSPQYFY